jgi:SAM-dependent methyltransferase
MTARTAAIANVEMAAAWNGPEGDDWARDWEHYDLGVAAHHARLMAEVGEVGETASALEVGCGNGQVTRELAATGARAVGVDLSAPMLARARELAAGLPTASFVQGDAQVHPFPEASFDVVVSRFGTMFFADRVEAFRNLLRATRPGGRLVTVTWQPLVDNPWLQAVRGALALGRDLPVPPPGAPGPFAQSDPDLVRAELEQAGWADVRLEDVRAPMWFGRDADDAYGFMGASGPVRGMLEGLEPERQEEGRRALRAAYEAAATPDGVLLGSAVWLTTARRPVV